MNLLTHAKLQGMINATVPNDLKEHIITDNSLFETNKIGITFNVVNAARIKNITKKLFPENDGKIYGLTIDWKILYKNAKTIKKNSQNKFSIFIDDELYDSRQLAFTVLHEFGHVKWAISPKERMLDVWDNNSELFSDFFAYDTLSELYGINPAITALELYSSKHGWQAHRKKF